MTATRIYLLCPAAAAVVYRLTVDRRTYTISKHKHVYRLGIKRPQ